MKILITGSAGRIGRAIYIKLMRSFDVVGLDKVPCSTADFVGDLRDKELIREALNGVDVVIHAAALHAPHVGLFSDSDFQSINVDATEQLALEAIKSGIKQFIFTSTTALYGYASTPHGTAGWIDETTKPQPKSIYHHTKIEAEGKLEQLSNLFNLPVTVLQISRCFPEPADLMAVYRLTRGIDSRDVASAHLCAVQKRLRGFNRFIISGRTPFNSAHCQQLYQAADHVLRTHAPLLANRFEERGWPLPHCLDRVYDSSLAQSTLDWQPNHGVDSVLTLLDSELAEVLPVKPQPPLANKR
ncbi:NAD(P)-dependent oxidoreductase [Psychrobium sp. 1_MG-2023]|uniref:NAD-dependent epimerase/dehydratase family protein n=1 Tax=Psychrobium sp. 1_MG-2023 TaxID=3062624 RepID=UPI000C32EADD|nr:NAD(P)-dependent oxidoreductase [Psychrobium sp. 1_MG-2023]MDP2562600.1 NAD(P)-dependent oxidoreductase [Psychrobium sp. 1_MG-2023]PKF59636.1 NAD(P)-dependent oxidoreductase [Alteromonadales bacterium alter-6D02]